MGGVLAGEAHHARKALRPDLLQPDQTDPRHRVAALQLRPESPGAVALHDPGTEADVDRGDNDKKVAALLITYISSRRRGAVANQASTSPVVSQAFNAVKSISAIPRIASSSSRRRFSSTALASRRSVSATSAASI